MRLYFVFQSGTEASTVSVKQWEAVRCIYWDLVFFGVFFRHAFVLYLSTVLI